VIGIVGPVLGVLVLVTIIGIPIGLGMLSALNVLAPLGYVASSLILGRLMVKGASAGARIGAFFAGFGILRAVAVIPGVGAIVWFLVCIYGLGALTQAAWRAGHGDFLETGQPIVEQLVEEGAAHLVVSMGDATGPLPFSSYMTTPARLRDERELLLAFARAVFRTQAWMAQAPGAEIARVVAPWFADIPERFRVAAVERYARQGTWARDPLCRHEGYEYLQQILLDGGFIKRRHRYEDLIDTSIAQQVITAAAS